MILRKEHLKLGCDSEIENSGKHLKSIFEIRIPNFCYIQVIVFDLSYNLNVTEVLDSTLKKSFPGIFNFTVGILMFVGINSFEPDSSIMDKRA